MDELSPDAWWEPRSGTLFQFPQHASFPLVLGDVLQYTQVLKLPFVTHDALYVGEGCVVTMDRVRGSRGRSRGRSRGHIRVARLDDPCYRNRTWRLAAEPRGNPPLTTRQRMERVGRALTARGPCWYSALTHNCQHAVARWCGDRPIRSVAVRRVVSSACAMAVVVASLLIVICWRRRTSL